MSYETKLTSGNERDRNQSAMTATERDKTHRRAAESELL